MTHNPYWNAGGERRWTAEEDATLLTLLKAGEKYKDIAKQVKRTHPAVKSRIRHLRLTEEQRADFRRQKTLCAPPTIRMKIEHIVVRQPDIPQEVWEDRNRRLMAEGEKNLTASFCKDPAPGYSALDKQRGRPIANPSDPRWAWAIQRGGVNA